MRMIPDRYNIPNLKKAIEHPHVIRDELRRLRLSAESKFSYLYFKSQNKDGPLDVMEQDWDNLIILDACRFDYFKRENNIEGKLNKVVSGGGESYGFMNHNFIGRELHDTVYVTANPHVHRIPDETFYHIENTLDQWSSDIDIVHPEDVASAAVKMHRTHPNKRLIIHFMQPHTPWLGPTAEKMREQYNIRDNLPQWVAKQIGGKDQRTGEIGSFGSVRQGVVSPQTIKQAYSETLNIVLDHTEDLLEEIPGKSVITADHGEMLGERVFFRRRWGHNNLWTKELRIVPWLKIKSDNRRHIVEDKPLDRERIEEDVIEKRLQALGYQ